MRCKRMFAIFFLLLWNLNYLVFVYACEFFVHFVLQTLNWAEELENRRKVSKNIRSLVSHRQFHVLFIFVVQMERYNNWLFRNQERAREWHKFYIVIKFSKKKICEIFSRKWDGEWDRANSASISLLINTFPKVNIHFYIITFALHPSLSFSAIETWCCFSVSVRTIVFWLLTIRFILCTLGRALLKCVFVSVHFFVFVPNLVLIVLFFSHHGFTWMLARSPIELFYDIRK